MKEIYRKNLIKASLSLTLLGTACHNDKPLLLVNLLFISWFITAGGFERYSC